MARGSQPAQTAETQANANATAAAGESQGELNNANALYSSIVPSLTQEVANPAGYNPVDLAAMETGAQQSAGGTQAGAVGEGGLLGARTRNSGAAANAIDAASRGAGEQLSKNALGIRVGNAKLKQQQQQEGLAGLQGVAATQTGAATGLLGGSNQALGETAANVNANTGATNASYDWATDILNPILSDAGNAASGGSFGHL